MNIEKLLGCVDKSVTRVVIGEVVETLGIFSDSLNDAPLGFCSMDLDLYSSTAQALTVFLEFSSQHFLPRLPVYFDNIGGLVPGLGELQALEECSEQLRKLSRILGRPRLLRESIWGCPGWADQMYFFHDFHHPSYNTHINTDTDMGI